ncbi:hypothetical protein ACXITP_08460 [Actinotignum sanguinis]|uniref:DUF8094 domain-containing protein n=3 Tax=Actinomycetaceae TaxID=2049 RepID=A0ABZ0RDN6_9ACTO|nr:hypothetical protein [Actinotignum sanguinis]WPJ89175.1 hypothetical protein R0V15_00845 [Schaalia turicensis]MDE1553574.1 hypothetical protein [Actinotignum sanguinis]MDE1564781.1 hypothetical protein [Actinotignum sanguinis]MDE1576816.1 hypothetical protein [Actinotignum sanguinis]MDE1642384.1 hypothetical protein [Actinotignum sanguinis]
MRKALATLAALALLGGCSANAVVLEPTPAPASPRAALSDKHFTERVAPAIFEQLTKADAAASPEEFSGRGSGPFSVERSAHYALKRILADSYDMPELSTTIDSVAISGAEGFPRSALAVVKWPANTTSQGLNVFTQGAARENWALWAAMDILPGSVIPEIPAGPAGAQRVAADNGEGAVASPQAAHDGYLGTLNAKGSALSYGSDADPAAADAVRTQLSQTYDSLAGAVQGVGAVSQAFGPAQTTPESFRASDGGILTVFQVNQALEIRHTAQGGSIKVTDAKIAGLATGQANTEVTVQGTMRLNYSFTVALKIPAAGAQNTTITTVAASKPVLTSVQNGG